MPLLGRLMKLATSPQGRKLLAQAQRAASDPKNAERIRKLRGKIDGSGGGGRGPGSGAGPR